MLLIQWWKNCCLIVICLFIYVGSSITLVADVTAKTKEIELPFTVPDGFVVQRVADDSLVHDSFCMTMDGAGRPVVSGPGYIRTLIDDNNDGTYDRSVQWSSLPKQGAQGLWSEGRSLYWVGDGGLWQSEDANGDLVADSSPKKIFDLPTGGEHDAHAIRRGPDGYWYLIVGNFASTISSLANDPNAPILRGRAGTLWRISPDFATRGVWAHGMRNCYDFDFLPDGQVVTYDSDCEREATLPWYRPTRVMALSPGSDAGWCGSAAKDDDSRVTMPLVLSRLGRGSPTGVVVYQHRAFPEKYHDAVFVLDWTFGRVIAVYPTGNDESSKRVANRVPSEVFMQPSGTAGFAPTDICVAPDGSLLVCVGGRGTAGSIYRVVASQTKETSDPKDASSSMFESAIAQKKINASTAAALQSILTAPCPWECWSESKWKPLVAKVGVESFAKILADEIPIEGDLQTIANVKQRCAQVMTRLRANIPIEPNMPLTRSTSSASRAAFWWIASRGNIVGNNSDKASLGKLAASIECNDITVESDSDRTRWEKHLGPSDQRLRLECMGLKRCNIASTPRPVTMDVPYNGAIRRAWLWALSRSPEPIPSKSEAIALDVLLAKQLYGTPLKTINTPLFDALARWIPERQSRMNSAEELEFLTSLQVCLGDQRNLLPLQSDNPTPHALDSYRGPYSNALPEAVRTGWVKWTLFLARQAKERGSALIHAEATRTLAMLEPKDSESLKYLVEQVDGKSHPTSDIHMLCCIANCAAPRDRDATTKTATALAGIVRKVKLSGLYTDNQWSNRLNQLIASLLVRDPQLGKAFVDLPIPCCQEDLSLVNSFPTEVQSAARKKVRDHLIASNPDEWTAPLMRYAAQGSIDGQLASALRNGANNLAIRTTLLDLIAPIANESDYELFLSSVESTDKNEWSAGFRGLNRLAVRDPQREFNALAPVVSASLNATVAIPRDEVLGRMRTVATKLKKPNIPSSDLWPAWESFFKANLEPSLLERMTLPKSTLDWPALMRSVNTIAGDAKRGQVIYQAKCGLCHGGSSALGPSLVGVTKRFSREDLSKAIFEPSRDISDRYRALRVLTVDGDIFTGMIIYNAADGATLQSADGSMLRINGENIEEKAYSTESLMPVGLLDDKSPSEVADLFAYLGKL